MLRALTLGSPDPLRTHVVADVALRQMLLISWTPALRDSFPGVRALSFPGRAGRQVMLGLISNAP